MVACCERSQIEWWERISVVVEERSDIEKRAFKRSWLIVSGAKSCWRLGLAGDDGEYSEFEYGLE